MNPLTVQKLQSDSPEFKELVAFLNEKVQELDTLDGVSGFLPEDLSIEVRARVHAQNALRAMLKPLIAPSTKYVGKNMLDYVA